MTSIYRQSFVATPTVKQLAAAYLEAAAAINRASHNAWAAWDASPQTLTRAKRLAKAGPRRPG